MKFTVFVCAPITFIGGGYLFALRRHQNEWNAMIWGAALWFIVVVMYVVVIEISDRKLRKNSRR